MVKKGAKNLLVGLDIGTSKTVAIVGDIGPDRRIEVVGLGSHPSRGLVRGGVVDIEATMHSIRRAVEEAELMAGCRIQSVYAGISGAHVKCVSSHGIVAVRNKEVTEADKERVIDAARAVPIPNDQKVLHVVPQEWSVDGQIGIREPAGMFGVRLESKVQMVSVSVSAAQNIYKCVERCGLHVDRLILEPLASAYAVLTPDEKDLGVCLVDIGHGTSDVIIFKDGSIRHAEVIPLAGEFVTRDIAMMFRTPTPAAEEIKLKYGCALPQLLAGGAPRTGADVVQLRSAVGGETFAAPRRAPPPPPRDEEIEVPSTGDHPPRRISRQAMSEVIKARYQELFADFVQRVIYRSGLHGELGAGVVLTGGSSKMQGVLELAEEIFEVPVRLGLPQNISGLTDVARNPIYSTAVGLLLFGRDHLPHDKSEFESTGMRQVLERMRQWFQGHF